MNKVQHPHCNGVVDMGDQGALPVQRVDAGDEGAQDVWTCSFWRPDAQELESILKGRPIIVMVRGTEHAALFLTAESHHAPIIG